jgi:hypothetical protein
MIQLVDGSLILEWFIIEPYLGDSRSHLSTKSIDSLEFFIAHFFITLSHFFLALILDSVTECSNSPSEVPDSIPVVEKLLCKIPSKTGYHLLFKPFDLRSFSQKYPTLDMKKDNPTNLFIP